MYNFKEFALSRTMWLATAVWILYIPIAWLLPREYLFDLVNALAVSIGIGVIVAYAGGALDSLRLPQRELTGGHYLVLGILITWFATAARHLYNAYWRLIGTPEELMNHPFVGFLVWMVATGGALHLTSKGAISGYIPPRSWLNLGIWIALGVFAAIMAITFLDHPYKTLPFDLN